MKPTTHVGAVVDSAEPAAWVVELLNGINNHPLMTLTVAQEQRTQSEQHKSQTGLSRLTDWLIEELVDSPQFKNDPWQRLPLDSDMMPVDADNAREALSSCDIVLHLSANRFNDALKPEKAAIWSVNLPVFDKRIKHALIYRAPFVWIHLWDLATPGKSAYSHEQRMASHALPCQSYSISDFRRLSYGALPAVILSRLNWHANDLACSPAAFHKHALDTGFFEDDLQLAKEDAQSEKRKTSKVFCAVLGLLLKKSFDRVHHRFIKEHWQLAVTRTPETSPQSLAQLVNKPLHSFDTFAQTDDVMWADPHLTQYMESAYVFFEKMHRHGEHAHIAYAKLDENGKPVDTGIALQADHHLSFPFIFVYQDQHYMLPETASRRSVSLYKATRFPDQWEHQCDLLSDINAADSIIFEHEERWWLFTNCMTHRSVDERDELHIYFAQSPTGPWQAHKLNPVLTGVDRARMAGAIIRENGALYRPSQYGAYRYGYGINLHKIDELTPDAYRESAQSRMTPQSDCGWSGCHSFAQIGELTIIDRVRFSRK